MASVQLARQLALTVAFSIGLAGCSFNVPVTAAHSDAAVARRIPLSIGYLLTPDLVSYEQPETVNGGHQLVFPIGKASQSAFPDMFAKLFTTTRAISGGQGALPGAEGVDAVIVPRLTESTIQGPELAGWAGSWHVTLGYIFVVYAPSGREVAHWQVEGSGSSSPGIDWTGLAGSNSAAAALSAALSDIENRFLTEFPNDSSIQRWLRSSHAAAS